MTLDDWCDYRVKIKCFAIFKRCFSNLVSKSLPSARKKTLGKGAFAVTFFTKCGLPSATLGKPFAECKKGLCRVYSTLANKGSPVVMGVGGEEGNLRRVGPVHQHASLLSGFLPFLPTEARSVWHQVGTRNKVVRPA